MIVTCSKEAWKTAEKKDDPVGEVVVLGSPTERARCSFVFNSFYSNNSDI